MEQGAQPGALWRRRGAGWGKELPAERTHVYMWLGHNRCTAETNSHR